MWSDEAWRCLCHSTARVCGLYLPEQLHLTLAPLGVGWRRVFFDHIWPARFKWTASTSHMRFDILVAVRFRAGAREKTARWWCVPRGVRDGGGVM